MGATNGDGPDGHNGPDDVEAAGPGAGEAGDRAKQGIEHLQAAARELIAAARAALDVAEDMVNDPESLTALAGVLGTLGEMARRVTGATPAPAASAPPPGEAADPPVDAPTSDDPAPGPAPRVQRIAVS